MYKFGFGILLTVGVLVAWKLYLKDKFWKLAKSVFGKFFPF